MVHAHYTLVIGDKNYSSWSLRPWLLMRASALDFAEVNIALDQPDTKSQIARYTPAGKVPALHAGDMVIWDSLAIAEYLAETHADKQLWPRGPRARAMARAISAEMHSGFAALRNELPMDLLSHHPREQLGEDTKTDIRRIIAIWNSTLEQFGNGSQASFLFGQFSIADAMFAPVATRFKTYLPDLAVFGDDGRSAAYVEAIFAMPAMQQWSDGAREQMAARKPLDVG